MKLSIRSNEIVRGENELQATNSSPQHNIILNNKTYYNYIPNTIISISTFYIFIIIIKYIFKRCRRYREKLQQKEMHRLKLNWKKGIVKLNMMNKCQSSSPYPDAVHYKDSSLSYASSITLNSTTVTIVQPSSNIYKQPSIMNLSAMTNNKRLNLLWQWGLSKGYCEYHHAKKLNDLIRKLQNQYHSTESKLSLENEKDQSVSF